MKETYVKQMLLSQQNMTHPSVLWFTFYDTLISASSVITYLLSWNHGCLLSPKAIVRVFSFNGCRLQAGVCFDSHLKCTKESFCTTALSQLATFKITQTRPKTNSILNILFILFDFKRAEETLCFRFRLLVTPSYEELHFLSKQKGNMRY